MSTHAIMLLITTWGCAVEVLTASAPQPLTVATVNGSAPYYVEFEADSLALKDFELSGDGLIIKYDTFVVEVHPEWAPLGAARFKKLVTSGFFKNCRFFRVVKGFVAQFGISDDPKVTQEWEGESIKDDPPKMHNDEKYVSFATSGPNSRNTQVIINLGQNRKLDDQGFVPFGKVVKGWGTCKGIQSHYGEPLPEGKGPNISRLKAEGKQYLKKFPGLTYIASAKVIHKPDLSKEGTGKA
jgi:peptidyl-prolyl cis-trans isomerase A (cyclophilin A)